MVFRILLSEPLLETLFSLAESSLFLPDKPDSLELFYSLRERADLLELLRERFFFRGFSDDDDALPDEDEPEEPDDSESLPLPLPLPSSSSLPISSW